MVFFPHLAVSWPFCVYIWYIFLLFFINSFHIVQHFCISVIFFWLGSISRLDFLIFSYFSFPISSYFSFFDYRFLFFRYLLFRLPNVWFICFSCGGDSFFCFNVTISSIRFQILLFSPLLAIAPFVSS